MIYIKPVKKAKISEKEMVTVKDIATIYSDCGHAGKINALVVLRIRERKNANYLISVLDVIKLISKAVPGEEIENIGEKDILIDYAVKKSKGNKAFQFLKIAFISIIMFAGSTAAIMSFHSDAQFPQMFKNMYYMFFNEKVDNPMLIDIPYSIGLAFGMIVFFNHFGFKKLTDGPTPIQVEMSMYEAEVTDTMIEILQTEEDTKEQGADG